MAQLCTTLHKNSDINSQMCWQHEDQPRVAVRQLSSLQNMMIVAGRNFLEASNLIHPILTA